MSQEILPQFDHGNLLPMFETKIIRPCSLFCAFFIVSGNSIVHYNAAYTHYEQRTKKSLHDLGMYDFLFFLNPLNTAMSIEQFVNYIVISISKIKTNFSRLMFLYISVDTFVFTIIRIYKNKINLYQNNIYMHSVFKSKLILYITTLGMVLASLTKL